MHVAQHSSEPVPLLPIPPQTKKAYTFVVVLLEDPVLLPFISLFQHYYLSNGHLND